MKMWKAVGFLHPLRLPTVPVITYVKASEKSHESNNTIGYKMVFSQDRAYTMVKTSLVENFKDG